MRNSESRTRPSYVTSRIGIWVSLSVLARIAKHLLIGPMQVINLPLIFAMVAGYLDGTLYGFIVGFLSFLISDSFLGIGIWTFVDGLIAGLVGTVSGTIRGRDFCLWELSVISYLLTFTYDVLTSCLLYMAFGLDPLISLITGLLGLFIPAGGGSAFMIGPITETITALTFSILVLELKKRSLAN